MCILNIFNDIDIRIILIYVLVFYFQNKTIRSNIYSENNMKTLFSLFLLAIIAELLGFNLVYKRFPLVNLSILF